MMTTPTTPPEIPKDIAPALDAHFTRSFEAAFAAKMQALPTQPQRPATSDAVDLLLDVPKERKHFAALGLKMKSAFLAREKQQGRGDEESIKHLGEFLVKVKSAGLFNSVFDQGGAQYARETRSAEVIELLRPTSILLRAGVRTESGYGSSLVIGRQDEGITVYWVAEGKPPQKSAPKGGLVRLGAHKIAALAPISNDLLRKGSMNSAADVGQDMASAVSEEVDKVGLLGAGGGPKPKGIIAQVPNAQKAAIAGTTTQNKIDDIAWLTKTVEKANIPPGLESNGAFYFMRTDTFWALRELRNTDGSYVFPGLQNLNAPTINGFPVYRSEILADETVMGFGLARQVYLGTPVPLEVTMGEDTGDFANDMVSMRGLMEVDWALRHTKAFSIKTGVSY